MFQMCFTDPNQGSASAQYIADKGLATKVAVIWKNDDVYSKGIHETFVKAACDTLGIEIVSDTTFADGNDTDFSVQIADAQIERCGARVPSRVLPARFPHPRAGRSRRL